MASVFKPCSVEGCNGNAHYSAHGSRGWCGMHWQRWRRHGDPTAGRTHDGELPAFLASAIANHTEDACLLWPFTKTRGYGVVIVNGRLQYAHRIVCSEVNGPPPTPAHQAAHACGVRACIAPKHLRWATPSENAADRLLHGTDNRGENHKMAKLSELQARQIVAMRGKLSQAKLAAMFGISREHIRDIHAGKSWGWL